VKAFFDTNVIIDVLTRREPFFGDSQAAVACGADCVVTRNVKHFADAQIPVYTPTEFLSEKGAAA